MFLDRDGVLVVPTFRDGRSYAPTSLEDFRLYPEAADCLARLKDAGFGLVVVTNQPDVGAGKVPQATVEEMHRRLQATLPVDAIKVCYHTSEANCDCRKPMPGMLLEAARELGIDPRRSFMVGDRSSDVVAGEAAGCRTVFIDLGYKEEVPPLHADQVVSSLARATAWILAESDKAPAP